tara:strand:- start:1575 stop:2507 length:933 start_codon:yes stop_codon:yes gene_type:complete
MNTPLGFLIIDKPKGFTSHDCVNRLRLIYKTRRIGHGGTLDPQVTGVLPIAIGQATRLLRYLPGEKSYVGEIQLGISTKTDDIHGEVIKSNKVPLLDKEELKNILESFLGNIQQIPPQVSSVHVEGERAYKRVRKGESIKLNARSICIKELIATEWRQDIGRLSIQISCSEGTYIRAIARDLGEIIGCGGCLYDLRRTKALGFQEEVSIPLPERPSEKSDPPPELINPKIALNNIPQMIVSSEEEMHFWRTGREIKINSSIKNFQENSLSCENEKANLAILIIDQNGEVAGIGNLINTEIIQPKIVFNSY